MPLTKKQINTLLEGVHSGELSLFNLPEEIFTFTFTELIGSVESGFGGGVGDFASGSLRAVRSVDYQQNIFTFSGAKTFNEVKDLSMFVFAEDGTKRPFKEFREFAQQINQKYNIDWLKTEQDTAFGMAQGADKWFDIEEDKELFPMLKYETAADERVRQEHADWDQLVFPVDDPFWNTRMPVNGYNCRCTVTKLTEGRKSSKKGVPKNSSTMFDVNPGKVNYIFNPEVHPYYKVEKRFSKELKRNFGFEMP
jgi:SPP1 gp7 family putative phage head morphogenesis protein